MRRRSSKSRYIDSVLKYSRVYTTDSLRSLEIAGDRRRSLEIAGDHWRSLEIPEILGDHLIR
eukprot:1310990-Amorphochlora_amoeboformis.AAC.1